MAFVGQLSQRGLFDAVWALADCLLVPSESCGPATDGRGGNPPAATLAACTIRSRAVWIAMVKLARSGSIRLAASVVSAIAIFGSGEDLVEDGSACSLDVLYGLW